MNSSNLFPLATGLDNKVGSQIDYIFNGQPNELIEKVTPVTAELIKFWFQSDYCNLRFFNFHEGQRASILNIIYAHEILHTRNLFDLYQAVAPEAVIESGILDEVSRKSNEHPKYAVKMATGTGKTWVLNALLIWQYLNYITTPSDERFTANFLVVAPGLIVYHRLLDSFLGKEVNGERNFDTSDIFATQDLFIPDNYREAVFGFLQSSIVTKADIGNKVTGRGMIAITNWHLLAGEEDPSFIPSTEAPGKDVSPKDVIESFFPITPGTTTGNSLDVLDRAYLRGGPLESLKELSNLLVFNDEAHHIHDIKKNSEVTEVEWQKSLTEIASTKSHRFIQIDFSATPFNQIGSGAKSSRHYFPHIVVDFDLPRAMQLGLVKALALDKRKEIAALPLDFSAERDEQKRIIGLSNGQRVMLRAGIKKLSLLEERFVATDPDKYPKLLIVCEDTKITTYVIDFLKEIGLSEDEILAVDSNRKGEMGRVAWEATQERLFDIDHHKKPKVIVSVLMLREGFDVNNICVIVPLRSTQAPILLEQTIGRGMRLMWRGDDQIDELKRETRDRIARHSSPTNDFDVLFVVEHPSFIEFYEHLFVKGLATEVDGADNKTSSVGDLEIVGLRKDFERYDFKIPFIIREAEEELVAPALNPLKLPTSKFPFEMLKKMVGKGDRFISHDAQTGVQYGDYRVDSGIMTATGYNDYLSRMTTRIAEALGNNITKSAKQYNDISRYPLLQAYKPQLTGWLDTYIKNRLFNQSMNPLVDENWRVLLLDDVSKEIAGIFASELTQITENQEILSSEVTYRKLSEVTTISVRSSSAVEVRKSIYPKLPIPIRSGGLERRFITWADQDSSVLALAKIHEYKHSFLQRPYLKADGMPGMYSPDFLVRTIDDVYVVETKAQSALSDENVQRKQRSALSWVEQINRLPSYQRSSMNWHYVLLGEFTVEEWHSKNAQVLDLLEFARIRETKGSEQGKLL